MNNPPPGGTAGSSPFVATPLRPLIGRESRRVLVRRNVSTATRRLHDGNSQPGRGPLLPRLEAVQHKQMPVIPRNDVRDDDSCQPTVIAEPLSRPQAEQFAGVLKAVADPTRLQLLSMISGSEAGEACVCDLTAPLGLTQPTVSHHLKILVDAGLLTRDKRGKWSWYAIVPEHLNALHGLLP